MIQIESRRGFDRPLAYDRTTAWLALIGGGWSVVDHFEREGQRYFVARRNEHTRALSVREHAVAHLVGSGRSNKLIAYALGLATSTIATHLATAMTKLGVTSRLELVTIFTALRPMCDRPSCADVIRRPSSLTPRASGAAVEVFEPEIGGPSYFVIRLAAGPLLAERLSPAEREIVRDVLGGLTNVEIAGKRERSTRTIANQLASIFRKLGVSSRFELTVQLTSAQPRR